MLFFIPVGKTKRLEILASGVLKRKGKPIKMYRKLAQALNKKELILVVDTKGLPAPTKHHGFYTLDQIPASHLLNLNPYIPSKEVIAAGGYVVRDNPKMGKDLLLIYRRGKWDLPKGKQDEGEHEIQTALREVREEVGIRYDLTLIQPLGSTQHTYERGGFLEVKTTYWYEMKTHQKTFTPQAEEDIQKVEWVEWYAAAALLGFPSLKAHHANATQILFPNPTIKTPTKIIPPPTTTEEETPK